MTAVIEKHRWIRAYEWVGSIDGEQLPYSHADYRVDFKVETYDTDTVPTASVVIKRAVSERDTLRRLVTTGDRHLVILESKPHRNDDESRSAVELALFKAHVAAYWLEDGSAEEGHATREIHMKRKQDKESGSMTAAQALDAAKAIAADSTWNDVNEEDRQKAINRWAELIAAQTKTGKETGILVPRREVFKLHLPQLSAEEAPGISAMSNGLTLECIKFESKEFSLR